MEYRSCGKGLAEMLVLFYFPKFVYSTVLTLTELKNVTSRNVLLKNTSESPLEISSVVLSFVYKKSKQGNENAGIGS